MEENDKNYIFSKSDLAERYLNAFLENKIFGGDELWKAASEVSKTLNLMELCSRIGLIFEDTEDKMESILKRIGIWDDETIGWDNHLNKSQEYTGFLLIELEALYGK